MNNSLRGTLWGFLLLLLLAPPLASLALNTLNDLFQHGGLLPLVVVAVAAVLCFQFRSNAARMAAVFFIFCFLSGLLYQTPAFGNSIWAYIVLIVAIVGAYFIREYRLDCKQQAPKLHGIERTPIFPPDTEEHE